MQNETSGKRAILSLACALAATVCGTLMASTFKCILPAPIRSAEVEHLLERHILLGRLHAGEAQRVE